MTRNDGHKVCEELTSAMGKKVIRNGQWRVERIGFRLHFKQGGQVTLPFAQTPAGSEGTHYLDIWERNVLCRGNKPKQKPGGGSVLAVFWKQPRGQFGWTD